MSARAAAAVACVLLAAPGVLAQTPAPVYELAVDASWQPVAGNRAHLRRDGQVLAVTLLDHPNTDRKKKPYRDQVVAALAAATPGYRMLERRDTEPSSSWVIDLTFQRTVDATDEVVAMRFYLVHDRTLVLAIATPAAAWPAAKAATMKILRSFRPPRVPAHR